MNKSNRIFFYVISRRWPWLDVVLPLCACFFPFVQSFVVRLALYSIISLCFVFIIPQEWGILWYNWVRVYCHCHFHLKQGCHVQNDHSAQKREIRCRREFTLNILSLNYHVFVVEKKNPFWYILGLNVALFFISVFMSADFDWLWSCLLLPALFPAFVFVSRPSYICLLLCLPIMTLLYSQMLFPCII